MRKIYKTPEMKISRLQNQDIIRCSGEGFDEIESEEDNEDDSELWEDEDEAESKSTTETKTETESSSSSEVGSGSTSGDSEPVSGSVSGGSESDGGSVSSGGAPSGVSDYSDSEGGDNTLMEQAQDSEALNEDTVAYGSSSGYEWSDGDYTGNTTVNYTFDN